MALLHSWHYFLILFIYSSFICLLFIFICKILTIYLTIFSEKLTLPHILENTINKSTQTP